MVTWQDMQAALGRLGVRECDSLLTHSSFKSLGETENGADTVVKGMQSAVGEQGTVVFPTLCQKDWEHVYENWHTDAPSDVGYLTNYFRLLPGAKRSNQATHSIAAIGRHAEYLTSTHGESGLRYGIFGDTPFSADSPWEKMYELNTKVLFLGVGLRKCTFRHYAEYCYMEKYLKKAQARPDYEALKARVWCYERFSEEGVWPHINNEYVETVLKDRNMIRYTDCGNARLTLISSHEFVDLCWELLEKRDPDLLSRDVEQTFDWFEEIDRL